MNSCTYCSDNAQHLCTCKTVHVCSKHVVEHLYSPGSHAFIEYKIKLDQDIKTEILKRVLLLEACKKQVAENTLFFIKKIEAQSQKCQEGLEKEITKYVKWTAALNVPVSVYPEIERLRNNILEGNTKSCEVPEEYFNGKFFEEKLKKSQNVTMQGDHGQNFL